MLPGGVHAVIITVKAFHVAEFEHALFMVRKPLGLMLLQPGFHFLNALPSVIRFHALVGLSKIPQTLVMVAHEQVCGFPFRNEF